MEKATLSSEQSQRTQASIMVVDDAPENLQMLELILKQEGYSVRPASDGSFALQSVQSALPDLILLDIMMPDIDGYEVCRRLKADERTRHIPVIFLSAMREQSHKVKAFQVGGIDYVTKPFQTEEVLARVKTHLSLQRMKEQLEKQNADLLESNAQLGREIAERRRAEDELQLSHDELEDRVARRTAQLAEANSALRESEGAAREFQEKLKALHEIGVLLSEAVNVDELCRESIELGRNSLGFDRLALFFLGDSEETIEGSFGTDPLGNIRDERELRVKMPQEAQFVEVLHTKNRVAVWQDTPLFDHWQEVGRGWNAMATLWTGERVIGWVAADNLIAQKPLAPYELELLSLFATTIGHLLMRKRAEEKLSQLKQAIEFMQIGVTITDLDGAIVYTNQAEAVMHGYQKEELIGRPSNFFAPEEFRVPIALRDVERWDGLIRESVNVRKDGTNFPVRLMSEVVKGSDGNPCALITSCEDISEREALEEERERYRSHLELLVKERTAELTATNTQLRQEIRERQRAEKELVHANEVALDAKRAAEAARHKAEAANSAKSQFLANMNHELRTPLNSILGFSQLLTHSPNLNDEQQEYIEIVNRNGEHLLTLINQVLDLSKIEAERMELDIHDFDLYHVLDELEHMFRLRAQKKQLQLIFQRGREVHRYVRTDEVKLRQVLINLLNNAIKFTEKGKIQLSVSSTQCSVCSNPASGEAEYRKPETEQCSPTSEPCLRFMIEDTGAGIAPEELETLFEAFVQTKSGQRSQEGTGLGLTICQRFIFLMEGTIAVDSEPGRGTVFTVVIPVQNLEAHEVKLKHPARQVIALEPNQPRCRILLVDDIQDSRHLLVNMLAPLDFDVREAENGQEGLKIWHDWEPHLILMDMRMPVMDGYEATKTIRKREHEQASQSRIPIIAITARTSEEERAEIFAAGCDDFLGKPLHETDIFEMIRRYLDIRFVYEGEEPPGQPSPNVTVTPEALAALPPELLENLQQMALRLNIEMIDRTIQRIQCHNEALATALANLANDFKYDRILAFIQEAEVLKTDT